jgi:hypothetical protein
VFFLDFFLYRTYQAFDRVCSRRIKSCHSVVAEWAISSAPGDGWSGRLMKFPADNRRVVGFAALNGDHPNEGRTFVGDRLTIFVGDG